MLFLFPVFFKVINKENYLPKIHLKAGIKPIECQSLNDQEFSFDQKEHRIFYCEKNPGPDILIQKCTFDSCKVHFYEWLTEQYAYLFLFKYTNINIDNCQILSCTYKNALISIEYHNAKNKFTFSSNTLKNNYDHKGDTSINVYSEYEYNDILKNSISFDSNENKYSARGFDFRCHKGLKFIENKVTNAYHNDGPGGLFIEGLDNDSNDEMIFSDCVFKGIRGNRQNEHFSTVIFLRQFKYELKITNVTFEHSRNDYKEGNYGKGYLIQFEAYKDEYDNPIITFTNCRFSYLESNGQSGGGIGLIYRKPPTDHDLTQYYFTINFERTVFEHIFFIHDSYGGGAISFSYDVDENRFTTVNCKHCRFLNVSSKNGGGGAIYYNAPQKLYIENTTFIQTSTKQSNQVGGAIYVKYQSGMMPIIIKDCIFEDASSAKGGAIYIEWNSQTTSGITISGCTFKRTNANTNAHSIMITGSLSNDVSINNCKFLDCGSNEDSFAIYLDTPNLDFSFNQIIFSQQEKSCGCVNLTKIVKHTFKGNLFQNAKFSDYVAQGNSNRWTSAGIHCTSCSELTKLIIENNTFNIIRGNNQGRCISIININNNNKDAVIFKNNSIQNCPDGGFLVKFQFTNHISEFKIDSCQFINNVIGNYWDSNVGSTPQIWIQNDANDDAFNLIYENCYFKQCQNTQNGGGAIRFKSIQHLMNAKLILKKCDFFDNIAKGSGGSIFIDSKFGCEISECVFERSRSDTGSGAIYLNIQNQNQKITIFDCDFTDNNGYLAHGIDIEEVPNAIIDITNCNFFDCGGDNYLIRIQPNNIESFNFEGCTIKFSKEGQTACGLYSNTDRLTLTGNTFQQFKNTIIRFYCKQSEKNTFKLIENKFIDCTGGQVIDVENALPMSPIIKGNTFENIKINGPLLNFKLYNDISIITFDNNTFSNFNMNSEVGGIGLEIEHEDKQIPYDISFNDCYFIGNTNTNNQQQGGAISFGAKQNNGNLRLTLTNCFFKNNHKDGQGSSIYINIQLSTSINGCQFYENIESQGTIYLVPDFGSNIVESSISISNCIFKQNQANKLSSIYVSSGTTKSIEIISCSFEKDEGSIFFDNFKNAVKVHDVKFSEIIEKTALIISSSQDSNKNSYIDVSECTFDNCKASSNNKCFDINTNLIPLSFTDIIIQNNIGYGCENYLGLINCNPQIDTFEFRNITFKDNTCESLYGGGIGIQIIGISQTLTFTDCKFINNAAKQNKKISRPTNDINKPYYNGDGGGIQLGYICTSNDFNVEFRSCLFKNNHAQRHGGAIAIQTIGTVKIIECIFENNVANYNFDSSESSELLIDNHFDKKNEGRGGAIYINPAYTYDDTSLSCKAPTIFLQSVEINKCKFEKNNGFDGYGIYIEGDNPDPETSFSIINNNFTNNYNESNHNADPLMIYGAVITTEIFNIEREQIIKDNVFLYDNTKLVVPELSYVDHFGNTPSKEFSKSDAFTKSNVFSSKYFSKSNIFTNSYDFSKSQFFSESNNFSKTNQFSNSKQFSNSEAFLKSDVFSQSNQFSKTLEFSLTQEFTKTNDFSNSKQFNESKAFSQSKGFSQSNKFSKTHEFSLTQEFTKTNDFSNSKQFNESKAFTQSKGFSDSKGFSQSNQFSKTREFTLTQKFTKTNDFSNSNQFSESKAFTQSKGFSDSKGFSQSNQFSKTHEFSLTQKFTKTNDFSNSNQFSDSESFSQSKGFSDSKGFSQSNKFSKTREFTLTQEFTKTNDFSNSKQFSESKAFTQSKGFSDSKEFSESTKFSGSKLFSSSNPFSLTGLFSMSFDFSKSDSFTKSKEFSQSFKFSHSNEFSSTDIFSKTEKFSSSTHFTQSNKFSDSFDFTPSQKFSQSLKFSPTGQFSLTNQFSKTEIFSLTSDFSKSSKFSISTKFSESTKFTFSNEFSRTNHFTLTGEFSKTTDFTESKKFTSSTKFTSSLHFTQTKHFPSTEKFSYSAHFTTSNKFTTSYSFSNSHEFSFSKGFTESNQFSASPIFIPTEPSCFIETEEGNLTFTDRCDYSELEGKNATVQIIRSNFTDFVEERDGAAVHIINCGVKCNGTKFIDCISTNGGGGGIYINNTIEHRNDVNLIGLFFLRCKAYYGGAVFVQSNYELNSILIKSCFFMSNEAYPKRTNEDFFYGGSSVFLMAETSELIDNVFTESKGKGGALRIADVKKENKLINLEENKNLIKIKGCSFEQSASIFYEGKDSGGSDIEIDECNFKGKLAKESRYIDGHLFEKNTPKFHLKNCKFESDINQSVNVELIKEISSVYVIKSELIEDDSSRSKKFLINVFSGFALFAISIAVFILKMKKLNNQNDDLYIDNFDEKFESNKL